MALTPEQITALQDENKALKKQCADMKTQLDELQAETKKAVKFARESEIKSLFTALGREYSESTAAPYLSFNAEQFKTISADLIAQKGEQKSNLPAHLFGTQAADGAEKTTEPAINTSAIYHQMNARGSN